MERLRTITRFWSWLPAFRAVGETSHLPSAAQGLHVTPSALSRALRQLERSLGRPLFRRAHRRLELTEEGERFLGAVRDAMRLVHEAAVELRAEKLRGTMSIASTGVATSAWVLPAVLRLQREHPGLVPKVTSDLRDVGPRLLSGRLDIAFQSQHVAHPRLRSEELGAVRAGIFCGPLHPLHGRSDVTLEDVQACAFVAPPPDAHGTPEDGWPVTLQREVACEVDRMRLGWETCLRAPLLAVLPEPVALESGQGRLWRLPVDVVPLTRVYGIRRRPIGRPTGADLLLAAVRSEIDAAADRAG